MKYKIGQKVKIRNDLRQDMDYHNAIHSHSDVANDEMVYLAGRVATIVGTTFHGQAYKIDLDNAKWAWTDAMFSETMDFDSLSPFQRWEKTYQKGNVNETTAV
jgi:hypothetical protein